jgi:tripartite-type tricarboxylate transporter receptor subunit TctC
MRHSLSLGTLAVALSCTTLAFAQTSNPSTSSGQGPSTGSGQGPSTGSGQGFPVKPIRLVVGFPAGGPADFFARTIAQKMTEVIGQQIVVDNRAGVSGMIAAEHVARTAPADGYVMYFAGTGVLTFAPNLYAKLPIDIARELTPLTLAVTVPEMLAVHPSLPVKTTKELVVLAKAKPKQLAYGSTGNGGMPHLAMESLRTAAGIELTHVPYKGAAPAVIDLLGGHVQMTILDVPVLLPHVKAGKMRALAVATAKRQAALPDMPTMTEAGYPSVRADNWYGVVVASATPKDIAAKLHAALVKTLDAPDTKERLMSQGAETRSTTPEQFAAFIREETATWGKIIKAAGVTLE